MVVTLQTLAMTWWVLSSLCVYAVCTQAYIVNAIIADPALLTCWTCPNKTDNEACNDWAPEKFCALNHTVCQTRHFVNIRTGKSISVLKQCAQPQDCTIDMIGCHSTDTPGVQECISCCDKPYCNEFVPSNHSTAHLYSSLPVNAAAHLSNNQSYTNLTAFLAATLSWTLISVLTNQKHCGKR